MSDVRYVLRDYQDDGVNKALWYLRNYNKPFVIQAATGAGKSLMIADICHKLDEPVLILQPSKELLEQNHSKLISYGVTDVAIYSASKNSKEIAKYTYATIGSIKDYELFKHFKYVIIDECHLVNPKKITSMYKKFLDAIGCTNVCGLTATPYRLDPKYATINGELRYMASLKMINRIPPFFFKKIAYQIETQELIDMGYLSPIDYYSDAVDLARLEVNSTGADYTTESMERFFDDKRIGKIAKTIQGIDKKHKMNLIFCSSITAAIKTQELLKVLGIESEVVTSKTKPKDRERIVDEFRAGKVKHLINVGVFTTGFDVPGLDSIIIARPTMSLALYYQMVGRGVRLDPENPNKRLSVYDFAGVVERLGRVETIRLAKEEDGFRDKVVSEVGTMTDVCLFNFKVKRNVFAKE